MKYVCIYINCIWTLRRRRWINEHRHSNPKYSFTSILRVLWQPAGSVEIRARSNIARLLLGPQCFFPTPTSSLSRQRTILHMRVVGNCHLNRHDVSPNIRSPGICKRIRDTWLTIGCEAFLDARRNAIDFSAEINVSPRCLLSGWT